MCIRDRYQRRVREHITSRMLRTRLPQQAVRSFSSMSEAASSVAIEQRGGMQLVTLNRPKALNALSLDMIRTMYPLYSSWQTDPAVRLIVQQGAGGKAFCAGGDVAALYRSKVEGSGEEGVTRSFFEEEYRLNQLIGGSAKPVVSLLDGIFMGGGVGLSVHGKYRVVTERSMFAMPETAIGLFPDVGGSHFLARLPGQLGMYLALTGNRLKTADLLYSQIATHCVSSAQLPELSERLSLLEGPQEVIEQGIEAVLAELAAAPEGEAGLEQHRAQIDQLFSGSSVEAIVQDLQADGGEWAVKQSKLLGKASPTSLKITHRQVREGASKDLGECLQMEFRMTQACMANKDFFEGVRAMLIDKDHAPVWAPDSLDQVSEQDVAAYFAPLEHELTFEN
eukprot:TRINITY_DN32543_c0_g1_i1.p1 TRINITY_DN32543_c0_g1~~TRINITY_DN32543_c0_g1_i1.p1  ORF type:complete len:428 (-),score=111.97 TRINITY_DN32543_c0_g1_i1:156-1337(-)